MSAGLARNWWAIALRGVLAVLFGVGALLLPPSALASLVLLFATYVIADGVFAIIAGWRRTRRGTRWLTLIAEGLLNLAAGAVLIWPAVIAVPLVHLAAAWAVITGGLLLAAARRLSGSHGFWILVAGGAASAAWGCLLAVLGPPSVASLTAEKFWLATYALLFGLALLFLAVRLWRRHREPRRSPTQLSIV